MTRFLEFLINHWMLSGIWLILFVALLGYLKKKSGKAISIHELTRLINREDGMVLDIRDRKVFEKGHIVDAVNIPLAKLEGRLIELDKHKEKPFVVVCQMGHQAADAVKKLQAKGYTKIYRLSGGISEWQAQGLPLV